MFPRVSTVHKQVYIYACQIFFVCPSLGLRGVCAPDFGQIIQSCTTIMKTSILCKILSRLEIVAFKRSTQSVHIIDADGVRNMSQTFSFGWVHFCWGRRLDTSWPKYLYDIIILFVCETWWISLIRQKLIIWKSWHKYLCVVARDSFVGTTLTVTISVKCKNRSGSY